MTASTAITGTAAGVPFLAVPPAGGRADAPVVVAWHLMDAPCTEAAFAAALPLAGLDAWRIYLGLPLCGSRLPAGGFDELMRLGYEDAVLNLQGPISAQAAAESAPAVAELRDRLGLGDGPVGLLGGSLGAAVAQQVVADRQLDVAASVLVSPLVQLRPAVEALGRVFGVEYPWSESSLEVARRMDFVARADEVAACPATRLVVGAEDDEAGFREPASRLRDALERRSVAADLVVVPGMGHALAEEPGIEPAPQLPAAAEVDRLAADWFTRHLGR
ncbi:S9 family peptidase [Pseudonocardia sp. MH-G8]|uniref:alpha/beta hydrolase family protein n=1 Tax=Pseudonocardia sp. MH-G8 TaxID=1854588 RepID=UPI000BA1620B|nr:prolyl oligopeptidase family serine peptidase [Pseudonocardia sp. MH-G8]OZM81848.1 alpha/beta hydrolase [Pseudonocardia sp. MH-G8]